MVGSLLMFCSLARPNRIGAFCSRNIPRHSNKQQQAQSGKLTMATSTAAPIELEHVSGDTLGGSGITLVPKVCVWYRCCTLSYIRCLMWQEMEKRHIFRNVVECSTGARGIGR